MEKGRSTVSWLGLGNNRQLALVPIRHASPALVSGVAVRPATKLTNLPLNPPSNGLPERLCSKGYTGPYLWRLIA